MHPEVERLIPALRRLATEIRRLARQAPTALGSPDSAHPVGQGRGDVTFHPDEVAEDFLGRWFAEQASLAPLSMLTEDFGWRHGGPGTEQGTWRELPDSNHGGPRVIIDPIDGTRHLLFELRSAWTVIGVAGPGELDPQQVHLEFALVTEIPTRLAGWARDLEAIKGQGCTVREVPLLGQTETASRTLAPIDDARVDHGYFPFFAYHPDVRAQAHSIAQVFLDRLRMIEGARIEHCYDDQYISSGGQLALLALGHYTMVADLRPWLLDPTGHVTQCAKPYDVSGAILCAQEAGCEVTDLKGGPLNMPLDTQTPVGFLAFAGPRTKERLLPHLREATSGLGGA
jgi:fructose-1,6-bisphosphatase/inositol monophosphatase family enzyme